MPKRRIGQPTKLTAEKQAKVIEAILGGSYFETACLYAGVSYNTGKEWLARGEGTDPLRPQTKLYANFATAVRDAEAKVEVGAAAVVKRAAFGVVDKDGRVVIKADADFALKFLARRFPRRWADLQKFAPTTPEGEALPLVRLVNVVRPQPSPNGEAAHVNGDG
jgi:hypothetical protein